MLDADSIGGIIEEDIMQGSQMGPQRFLLKTGPLRGIKEFFNADLIRTLLSCLRGPF